MIEIAISASDLEALRSSVLGESVERAAVAFASQVQLSDGTIRLLVRSLERPATSDYRCQEIDRAVLAPEFIARVTKRATLDGVSLLFVHSHPGPRSPQFSVVDDDGERHLAKFLRGRHGDNVHGAIVMSAGGIRARELGTRREAVVVSLGERRTVLCGSLTPGQHILPLFDRQIRAFGAEGQRTIQGLRVGIVGLGGTGSIVAEQLVHLGVQDFVLIDPDLVEETNLNRVVGATAFDVGRSKIDVAARNIRAVAAGATVKAIQDDVIHSRVALNLRDVDIFFGCTDSHGSRAVLQQVAYQYLIPCIDVGAAIVAKPPSPPGIFGRVQLLAPGYACLTCSGLLNADEVRRDMMSAFERKLDPYIEGAREPAPSVIALNGTVSSLAVTMFMAYVAGVPSAARYLLYNGTSSTLRTAHVPPVLDCYICSPGGTLARGDSVRLFARQD